jgi:hypothetical protein
MSPASLLGSLWTAALVVLMSAPAFATDCNTDCESHCTSTDTWWSPLLGQQVSSVLDQGCMLECESRRKLACSTRIDQCNIWSSNPNLYTEYRAAVAIIERANRSGHPADKHECHRWLDLGANGAGAASAIRSAWQYGADAALWLKNFSMAGLVVAEGTKHFMHCACSAANYREVGGNGDGGGAANNDMINVSARRADGAWWNQSGRTSERAQIFEVVRSKLGSYSKAEVSYFASTQPTTVHAICGEASLWRTDTGQATVINVTQFAVANDLKYCLVRVVNGIDTGGVFDRASVSLWRNNGAWGWFTGAKDQEESMRQQAQQFLDGPAEGVKIGYYSSRRGTATRYSCDVGTTTTDGGLIVSSSETGIRFSFAGAANGPLSNELASRGLKRCQYSVYDVTF